MAKYVYITTQISRIFNSIHPSTVSMSSRTFPLMSKALLYSTTATPYPLQYDMILSRPAQRQNPTPSRRRRLNWPKSKIPDSEELGFDDWVDKKLNSTASPYNSFTDNSVVEMDKSKRKYYSKRRKRMYGSDSEDDNNRQGGNDFVELKQEVVELRTLHKKEEELYFYDTFAYPWEKDKHYKMVYQLEKKYFPDQCFDKAFLEPGQSNEREKKKGDKRANRARDAKEKEVESQRMVFFDDGDNEKGKETETDGSGLTIEVSEKRVEEFFKCLKKLPNNDDIANTEPFLSSRSKGLPPQWDTPAGTVLLVNKPKGEDFWVFYAG